MTLVAATPNEQDLMPSTDGEPVCEEGTLGWGDDPNYVDLGTGDNSGVTFLHVTLYRGKDPHEPLNPTRAQGTQIRARMSGTPLWHIPPIHTKCIVMFPAGRASIDGAGVVLGFPGANPLVQFSKTRAKLDVGPDQDLVIKGRSITLSTYENDFIAIGPDTKGCVIQLHGGTQIQITDGNVLITAASGSPPDAKTFVNVDVDEVSLVHKDATGKTATVCVSDGDVSIGADKTCLAGGAVMLGAVATLPVLTGSPPGVPSTSVFSQS